MTTEKEKEHLSEYLAILQREALKMTGDIKNAEINREKWLSQTQKVIDDMKEELDASNAKINEIMDILDEEEKEEENDEDAEGIPATSE